MTRPDAIIVGAGIAGMAAALRLAERGARVLVLETRKKLGGRATSFTDPRSGLEVDNCQHIAMGCCTNYLDLCARLGVADAIAWHDHIHWIEAGGRRSTTRPSLLPAPAQNLPSLLNAAFLTMGEKLALIRAMNKALRADRARFADITFADWLHRAGQPTGLVRKFWSPLMVSACNADVHRVAASVGLHVAQEGMLASGRAAEMGVPAVPLRTLYQRFPDLIRSAGGEVREGAGVARLGPGWVETTAGERTEADHVICALPAERAAKVVDENIQRSDDRFRFIDHLDHSPILGVHLTFDRPVLDVFAATFVDRPTQWLFRKDRSGRAVHAVVSAAHDWLGLPEQEMVDRVLEDLHACLPDSRGATIESARAVMEKRATFTPTPAFERARPATSGPSGVILAGDYVAIGWPSTMEGATRSGYAAAAAALGEDPAGLIVPSLTPSPIVRLVGGRSLRAQHRALPAGSAR